MGFFPRRRSDRDAEGAPKKIFPIFKRFLRGWGRLGASLPGRWPRLWRPCKNLSHNFICHDFNGFGFYYVQRLIENLSMLQQNSYYNTIVSRIWNINAIIAVKQAPSDVVEIETNLLTAAKLVWLFADKPVRRVHLLLLWSISTTHCPSTGVNRPIKNLSELADKKVKVVPIGSFVQNVKSKSK